jgi:spermidine synthase
MLSSLGILINRLSTLRLSTMKIKANSGTLLHRQHTPMHSIEVREDGNYRWLHFGDGAIQSAASLSDPSTLVLPYLAPLLSGIEVLRETCQHLLILGLGAGSLYHHFRGELPQCKITVVEINPAVIDIATRFFGVATTDPRLEIVCEDAKNFLANTRAHFDVIISDIYSTDQVPPLLKTQEYYQHGYQRLNHNGVLALNLLSNDNAELTLINQLLRAVFENACLTIPMQRYANTIMLASKVDNFYQRLMDLQTQGELLDIQYDFSLGYVSKQCLPARSNRQALFEKLFNRKQD